MAIGAAAARDGTRLETNEGYIEEISRAGELAIGDPSAVLAFVLKNLPETAKVYPTENYYYFRFLHEGVPYAGSLRFDPRYRDQGKLEFSYYKDMTGWSEDLEGAVHTSLDASNGVVVERTADLAYRVTCAGKSVVFALNDLSAVTIPPAVLGPGERFLGPIFDESGVRFYFVYNQRLRLFLYVLDETVPVRDEFLSLPGADRIVIGRRTGFGFYRDHHLNRKILIGAYEQNSRINNYFDGPFDQLPENFIRGEELREAIVESDPEAKGQIDRLGNYLDGDGRYLIHPYMLYAKPREMARIHSCAMRNAKRPGLYYRCFVTEPAADDAQAERKPKRHPR